MSALLLYFLKVIAIQAVLYLFYMVVFHKSGRHASNRFFIIASIIISFLIPFFHLPVITKNVQVEELQQVEYWFADLESRTVSTELIPVAKNEEASSYLSLLFWLIPMVSLLLFMRFIYSYYQFLSLKRQAILMNKSWFYLYKSPFQIPFSFFKYVFLPTDLFDAQAYEQVLAHECSHVKMKHSIDRVFFELMVTILWFNPMLHLFKKRLIETHEFQADECVIQNYNDPLTYQETLYNQLSNRLSVSFANHFNFLTIKNRIKMINKTKKLSGWVYSFSLPVLLMLAFVFSSRELATPMEDFTADVTTILSDFSIETDYIPSILPLKETEKVAVTSNFGKRIHPILKVEKMHEGVDFKTPTGNPILATANGTIVEAGRIGDYGLKVIIDHNGLYKTTYSHLSKINVKKGDKVSRGQQLALSGSSGVSIGPHLHYEVIESDQGFVDPIKFIHDFDFKLKAEPTNKPLKSNKNQKFRVVIDPGHGGTDRGVNSTDLDEKEIVLEVAKELAARFASSDQIEIVLTRKQDEVLSLSDRIAFTEEADLFISLHVERHENAEEDMLLPIFIDQGQFSQQSEKFAHLLAEEFTASGKNIKSGYSTGYYVLKNAKCTPVLFNIGYVSNTDSDQYLNSEKGRSEIAQDIADAIQRAAL